MQELRNRLIAEVGLSAEQAQKTIDSVLGFVKSKVPAAMADNIDAMFSGMKVEEKVDTYKDKAKDFADATKDKLEDFADAARDKISDVADDAEDFADAAKDRISDAADKAEDFAKEAFGKIKGMFGGNDEKKA